MPGILRCGLDLSYVFKPLAGAASVSEPSFNDIFIFIKTQIIFFHWLSIAPMIARAKPRAWQDAAKPGVFLCFRVWRVEEADVEPPDVTIIHAEQFITITGAGEADDDFIMSRAHNVSKIHYTTLYCYTTTCIFILLLQKNIRAVFRKHFKLNVDLHW